MSITALNVVFGTGAFGYESEHSKRTVSDKAIVHNILEVVKKHGHHELDTARIYGAGTSERVLGEVDYQAQGFIVGTKVNSFTPGAHSAEGIAKSLQESLKELKTNKVHILYLHAPDRTTPFEVTLAAIDAEYKKGHFEHFGLSNYTAEEVEQFVQIAKEKGYVKPTVYQGLYNLLVRGNEDTLFPVLRKHGIRFYAYSPLAGGFLTDDISSDYQPAADSRFDGNSRVGAIYKNHFWKDSHFKALEALKEAAKKHNFTVAEVAFRWIVHHSILKREFNDAIIIGGRSVDRIELALHDLEKPVLPDDVLKAVNGVWELVKHDAAKWHL